MPKVAYDLTDIDDLPDSAQAPVGTYVAKIEECEAKDSSKGNPMLEIRWRIIGDATGAKIKEDYAPIWDYPILKHDSKFVMGKTKAFLVAIGEKLKGQLDPNKLVGKKALIKLKSDTDDSGDYRPRIGKVLPVSEADAGNNEEEPEEVEPEAEPEDDAVDLDAMSRDELKKFIRSEKLGTLADLGIKSSTTDDQIRDIIAEKMGGGEAEPEEEEPEPEPEDEPEPEEDVLDLDSMSRDELKKLIKDEKLGTLADLGINKNTTDDQIREIIQGAMGGGEEEPEPEEEPEAEPEPEDEAEPEGDGDGDSYDSMDVKALAADVKERSLDVPEATKKLRGAKLKAALIELLRADDAESPF